MMTGERRLSAISAAMALIIGTFAAETSFDFSAISSKRFAPPPPISNAVDAATFKRRFELPHATGGIWRLTFDYTLDHSVGDRIFGARTHVALGPKIMPWGADVRGMWLPDSGVERGVLYPWRHDVQIMPGTTFADVYFDCFGKGDFRVANVEFTEIPPDEEPITLEMPFGGYMDGEFHIGAGQVGFPMMAWRTVFTDKEEVPSERFGCRVTVSQGFTLVDVSKTSPARSRTGESFIGIAIRADCEAGCKGDMTIVAELDGRTASKPLKLRLLAVPPVKVSHLPERYANGAYLGSAYSAFSGEGNRAIAETLHDAGVTWLIPDVATVTNNPSILPMWRKIGMKRITPDGSGIVANGFSVGRKYVCPCALYRDDSPIRMELREKLKKSLRGCDGMWSNWEPYEHSWRRRRILCKSCAAAEMGLDRRAMRRLRSSEHGRVVAAVAADVAAATDAAVGFIPGIYWPELGPGHETFAFTQEIQAGSYLRELSYLNAFGPYVRWNTTVRYLPEPGRALAYFCVAREVMRQLEEDCEPEARPSLMAFPLGCSGMSWVSRPEWLELALESFFFNGWGCAAPWSFPAGGDARFLAAVARATECAAKWESFVWNGARADGAVSVKPRGTVRTRGWIDRTYLTKLRDVPLLQHVSWEKGGDRIVAVFNFDEKSAIVCDVSLRKRIQTLEVPPSSCRVAVFRLGSSR